MKNNLVLGFTVDFSPQPATYYGFGFLHAIFKNESKIFLEFVHVFLLAGCLNSQAVGILAIYQFIRLLCKTKEEEENLTPLSCVKPRFCTN